MGWEENAAVGTMRTDEGAEGLATGGRGGPRESGRGDEWVRIKQGIEVLMQIASGGGGGAAVARDAAAQGEEMQERKAGFERKLKLCGHASRADSVRITMLFDHHVLKA